MISIDALITADDWRRLEERYKYRSPTGEISLDTFPVVRLYTPEGTQFWLLTEGWRYPNFELYGLSVDLLKSTAVVGRIYLDDVLNARDRFGNAALRDAHLPSTYPLSVFYDIHRMLSKHGE